MVEFVGFAIRSESVKSGVKLFQSGVFVNTRFKFFYEREDEYLYRLGNPGFSGWCLGQKKKHNMDGPVEGGCDMSLKYPESKGGFVKFHPPPSTEINYIFSWLFNCGYYTQLQIPPPKTLQLLYLQKQKSLKKQYGNRNQRSFIKIQETFRKGRSDPKNLC